MSKSFEFFKYIKTPLSDSSIMMLYQSNGILYEKSRLFGDIVLTFFENAFNSYLGDDIDSSVYTLTEQRKNHFNWAWSKTMEDFGNEGITFNNDKQLREYFSSFMFDVYYPSPEKGIDSNVVKKIRELWGKLFDYKGMKTHSDVDCFIEVYQMFDEELKNKKKA